MKSIPGTLQEGGAGFQTTHWTVVLHAQQTQSEVSAQKALSNFCEAYWPPLYAFLRHRGHASPESGLAAIRDSRIAFYQMSFGNHPRRTRYRKPARELLKGGRVSEAKYEPPLLSGYMREGTKNYRSRVFPKS